MAPKLHPGERTLYEGHPSWRSILDFYIKGLLVTALICLIVALATGFIGDETDTSLVVVIALVGAAVTILAGFIKRVATNYTITATNTTSNTVFSVTMKDPLLGGDLTSCTDGAGTSTPPPVDLAPTEKLICTGSYQTTAADVSAGTVVNVATVRGNGGDD